MRTAKKAGLVSLFVILVSVSRIFACTIITASNSEIILFAGNQDQDFVDSYLIIDNSSLRFVGIRLPRKGVISGVGSNNFSRLLF